VSYDPNQSWGSAPSQSQPNAPTWPGYGQQPAEGTYPGNVPPPPGGYPGYPPPPGAAAQPYYGAYPGPMAPPTNGWAIASLACSIAAWFGFFIVGAIAGIICGHIALGEIKRSEGRYEGRGMAIAGLIISYAQIALVACIVAGIVAAFAFSANAGR
jgi:hypothetical protein